MNHKKALVMATGGLDSTTLIYWIESKGIEAFPIFIDYEQHCASKELETLKKVVPEEIKKRIVVIELRNIFKNSRSRLITEADLWTESISDDDLFLPYRNLLLLTAAFSHAATNAFSYVYAGFINTNDVKEIDSTEAFLKSFQQISGSMGTVELITPFKNKNKKEIFETGLALGVPVLETYSCQAVSSLPCGACPNCVERQKALQELVW